MAPLATAMFIIDWPTKIVVQPIATRRNWLPLDRSATRKPIRAKTAKNSSTTTEPTKPNSSA